MGVNEISGSNEEKQTKTDSFNLDFLKDDEALKEKMSLTDPGLDDEGTELDNEGIDGFMDPTPSPAGVRAGIEDAMKTLGIGDWEN